MANPILRLLVLFTLCGTCPLGVLAYYDCKYNADCVYRNTARPPVDPSVDLSLNLLRHLYSPSRNLVFSPYSLVTALTMTLLGAEGDSRRQLLETLFGSKDERRVEQFIAQHRNLTKFSAEQLQMANFLYSDKRFPLKPEYFKEIGLNLSGIAKTVNFSDTVSAMETINSDVSEATHGLIPQVLTQIDPSAALLLLNTVNFKGTWEAPFKVANTNLTGTFTKSPSACFTNLFTTDGEEIQVPMMHHTDVYFPFYEEGDGTKALFLPVNVPEMHLVLLLPPEGTPIHAFIRFLSGAYLESLLKVHNTRWRRRVNVTLPRFKLSRTHSNLLQTLESLGVSDIFSPDKANFSKLTQNWEDLAVSQVLQKATIEVNEEGTGAKARLSGSLVLASGRFYKHEFNASRPFVYALVCAPSSPKGTFSHMISVLPAHTQILLMGVVEDPSKE